MAKKRPPNKEESERMGRLIALGCFVGQNFNLLDEHKCGGRLEIHHIRRMGAKTDHKRSFCLCTHHHQVQTPLPHGYAVHKSTKLFEKKFGTQEEILEIVEQQLEGVL